MFSEDDETQPRYHHGNVKEALISRAMKFIENDEADNLSLRRLAREVGVSPSAVYNHFPDKNALMLAIKIRLYQQFNEYFAMRQQHGADAVQRLHDMCLAYYHFACEQPARFQVLFGSTLSMEWSTQELVDMSCVTINRLRKLVLSIYEKHNIPCSEEEAVNTSLLIWCQLHGIIQLKNSGSIRAAVTYQDWPEACALQRDEDVERLIQKQVNMTVQGILNSQYHSGHH